MPLDADAIWGKAVADAIKAVGVTAGTPVNDTKLEQIWTAIVGEHKKQLNKAAVAPGTFVDGSALPVTGIGGPVT